MYVASSGEKFDMLCIFLYSKINISWDVRTGSENCDVKCR